EQEGKNASWESLIAWQMENENSHFPIERHTPVYPKQAIAQGIVGYAVVEFSIDAKGRTQSQKAIEEFPAGVFAAPSLRAIKRFKYAPILGPDGKVIERDQVTNKFTFTL